MRFELPLSPPTGAADALSAVRAWLRADPQYHDPIHELVVSIPEGDGFPEADHLSSPTTHADPTKTRALIACAGCYSDKCKATAPWYSMTRKFGRVPQVRAQLHCQCSACQLYAQYTVAQSSKVFCGDHRIPQRM